MIKRGSELYQAGKMAELYKQDNVGNYEKIAAPLAGALAAKLAPHGITPVFAWITPASRSTVRRSAISSTCSR